MLNWISHPRSERTAQCFVSLFDKCILLFSFIHFFCGAITHTPFPTSQHYSADENHQARDGKWMVKRVALWIQPSVGGRRWEVLEYNRFVVVVALHTMREIHRCRWTAFSAKKCFTISTTQQRKPPTSTDDVMVGDHLAEETKKPLLCVWFDDDGAVCDVRDLGQGNYEWQTNYYAATVSVSLSNLTTIIVDTAGNLHPLRSESPSSMKAKNIDF